MKIVVLIKQVPETSAVRMDESTGTMIRAGVESIVNPLDLYAIESAVRLRQALGGEVVAVSMGPRSADKALREAIAMGCDSGVLVSDKAFAGSDTWATSYILAAAIRRVGGVDIVICGERATDGDTGQVGPGVAAFLDLPVVTYVSSFERVAEGKACVRRLIEDGYEVLDLDLPAVLTVVKEVAEPSLPTLRGKQNARDVDLPVLSPADLDVETASLGLKGSPTRVVKIFRPKVARECRKVPVTDDASAQTAATDLVAFLREKELI